MSGRDNDPRPRSARLPPAASLTSCAFLVVVLRTFDEFTGLESNSLVSISEDPPFDLGEPMHL